jgi:hypothetical protein
MTESKPKRYKEDFSYLDFVVQGVHPEAVLEAQNGIQEASTPRPKTRVKIVTPKPEKSAQAAPIDGGDDE